MSLIHEALKKAEKERDPSGQETPGQTKGPFPISTKAPPPKRVIIYLVLIVFSLGLLLYLRVFNKPEEPAPPPQPKAFTPETIPTGGDPKKMQEEALGHFQEKRLPQARVLWERLTILTPTDSEVYNNLGITLKKMGLKKEAYEAYQKALALKQDYPEALNNFGVLLLNEGSKDKAKENFQKAIQLKTDYAEPYFNLAVVLEGEGNFKGARENYQRFLELSPGIDAALKLKIEAKLALLK